MQLVKYFSTLLLSAAAFFPAHLAAQLSPPSAEELLQGTWHLDLQRSIFFEREAPSSQVLIFEPHEEGLRSTVIFVDADGEENRISYVATQDDVPAPLAGSEDFDAVILQGHGPYHATANFTHAGRVVGRAERTISMDGKEMRVEVTRNGDLSSRAVFVKQE